jgi:hypothetical protein
MLFKNVNMKMKIEDVNQSEKNSLYFWREIKWNILCEISGSHGSEYEV